MQEIARRWIDIELRAGARWFGFAVAAAPVVDRLDDAGWITTLASGKIGRSDEWPQGGLAALGWSALFVALGIAAAAVMRRHGARGRWWFFAGCAAPMLGYVALGGFRLSAGVSLLGFAVAALRLRAGRAPDTLQSDGVTDRARYAGGSGDVGPLP
jgi:hypothetical protein